MPLLPGKQNIGKNVKTEEAHGKPKKQAVAIALNKAGVSKANDRKPSWQPDSPNQSGLEALHKSAIENYGGKYSYSSGAGKGELHHVYTLPQGNLKITERVDGRHSMLAPLGALKPSSIKAEDAMDLEKQLVHAENLCKKDRFQSAKVVYETVERIAKERGDTKTAQKALAGILRCEDARGGKDGVRPVYASPAEEHQALKTKRGGLSPKELARMLELQRAKDSDDEDDVQDALWILANRSLGLEAIVQRRGYSPSFVQAVLAGKYGSSAKQIRQAFRSETDVQSMDSEEDLKTVRIGGPDNPGGKLFKIPVSPKPVKDAAAYKGYDVKPVPVNYTFAKKPAAKSTNYTNLLFKSPEEEKEVYRPRTAKELSKAFGKDFAKKLRPV